MKSKLVMLSVIFLLIFTGCLNYEAFNDEVVDVVEDPVLEVPEVVEPEVEEPEPEEEEVVEDGLNDVVTIEPACDFSKDIELRESETYSQMGNEEFDTVVCGYFSHQEEIIFDQPYDVPYLNIIDYLDEGFKESIQLGLAGGNTVNAPINETLALNLGCFEDGKIIGVTYEDLSLGHSQYIEDEVMEAILASTEEEPVSLILSYGLHEGFGCTCCNLMHEINLY